MSAQVAAWVGGDAEGAFLVRLYAGGSMTVAVKAAGSSVWSPEVELSAEVFDFGSVNA